MTLDILREFFFWNMVINMGLLTLSFIMLTSMRGPIARIHRKMFNLSEDKLNTIWYSILGCYKIAIFMFNVVPYVAIRIVQYPAP